ncbi:hypothetical protein X777_10464 [Ooceraea biroi]|uniref:Uncharacterized protein n=1 Tax=Ooceraea biroi TaxID=2015173 RepID=A0A026W5E0_OOCBI|nr:hypothetical protein X777_10464 [Ooceraea biroi]
MLSGQLAINRGAEPSGPLIAPGKKAVAEVERPSEREEVQGAYASRRGYPSHASFTPDFLREILANRCPKSSPDSRRDQEIPMPRQAESLNP